MIGSSFLGYLLSLSGDCTALRVHSFAALDMRYGEARLLTLTSKEVKLKNCSELSIIFTVQLPH